MRIALGCCSRASSRAEIVEQVSSWRVHQEVRSQNPDTVGCHRRAGRRWHPTSGPARRDMARPPRTGRVRTSPRRFAPRHPAPPSRRRPPTSSLCETVIADAPEFTISSYRRGAAGATGPAHGDGSARRPARSFGACWPGRMGPGSIRVLVFAP